MAGAVADSFFPPNPAALMLNKHTKKEPGAEGGEAARTPQSLPEGHS